MSMEFVQKNQIFSSELQYKKNKECKFWWVCKSIANHDFFIWTDWGSYYLVAWELIIGRDL